MPKEYSRLAPSGWPSDPRVEEIDAFNQFDGSLDAQDTRIAAIEDGAGSVAARIYLSADVGLTDSTPLVVPFDSEGFATDPTMLDLANNAIIVRKSGVWWVGAMAAFTSSGDGSSSELIYLVNNVGAGELARDHTGSGRFMNSGTSAPAMLNAGDSLTLRARMIGSDTTLRGGAANTYLYCVYDGPNEAGGA